MFGRRSFPKGRRPSARRPVMNEKREFQRSESFAAAALLALSGGLLDAYTYLCRGGVFANAQTGNMVLLAIRAAEGKWQEAGRYLIPILAFAAGAMIYVVVEELIPEMSAGEHSNIGTLFFGVGFCLMMILDVALG